MASSNIKLFDENKGNMISDSEFNISNQRLNGLQTGVASSQLQNKAMYQASLVAYAIAQIMMQNGKNANDTDAVSTFVSNLSNTMLQKVYDLATTAEAQAGVATGKWMSPALVKAAIDTLAAKAQNILSDNTKLLFGLSSDAVPDDAFKEISRHISAILDPKIIVTAPTGYTVTCTKGTTVLTAQEVEGTWTFDVQEYGEWTLTATNGLETNSRTVLIDIVGIYKIKILMPVYLYKDGDGADNFTAETSYSYWNVASDMSAGIAQKDSTSLYFGDNSTSQYQVGGFKTTVDFAEYSELHVRVALHGSGYASTAQDSRRFCIYLDGKIAFENNNVESSDYEEYVIDISSYGSNTVLGLMCQSGVTKAHTQTARVSRVWMD